MVGLMTRMVRWMNGVTDKLGQEANLEDVKLLTGSIEMYTASSFKTTMQII